MNEEDKGYVDPKVAEEGDLEPAQGLKALRESRFWGLGWQQLL